VRKASLYLKTGEKEGPLCLFIHGLGMSHNIWLKPEESKVLGGRYPVGLFLSRPPRSKKNIRGSKRFTFGNPPSVLKTSLHDLQDIGYTVLAYSQQRPMGGIDVLLEEIDKILDEYSDLARRGIIFITHSRGGILARLAIQCLNIKKTLGLITIATPHKGSSMADMARLILPVTKVLYPFFARSEQGTVKVTIKRVIDFLSSPAVKELTPHSELMKSMKSQRIKRIKTISFGGTNPTLFTLYKWHKDCMKYRKVFSIPDVLTGYLPERMVPDELKNGRGDSLVTADSAVAPEAVAHYNYYQNHAGLIFNRHVRKKILEFVREL
jgi:pimeloyl-ACP methyl ester carboxylesterase